MASHYSAFRLQSVLVLLLLLLSFALVGQDTDFYERMGDLPVIARSSTGQKEVLKIPDIIAVNSNGVIMATPNIYRKQVYRDKLLYLSLDGGKSWENITTSLPGNGEAGENELTFHGATGDTYLFAMGEEFLLFLDAGYLLKTSDNGKTWRSVKTPEEHHGTIWPPVAEYQCGTSPSRTIIIRGYRSYYQSDDLGETWTTKTTTTNTEDIRGINANKPYLARPQ